MSDRKRGIILKGIGGFYYVLHEGQVIECKAGGRLRKRENSPIAGDCVLFELNADVGLISEIEPRKNYFVRPPIANVDRLFIAATEAEPETTPYLIDKMAAIALFQDVEPVILLTKSDLSSNDKLYDIYSRCGFKVIKCSAETKLGCKEIKALTENSISVFSGNSGVGKSSILNALQPDFRIQVGEVSDKLGRGRHTTRHVELFRLDNGAIVADTPGFSSFDTEEMELRRPEELEHTFREFEPYLGKCRFTGCAHVKEKGCAVLAAVKAGEIAPSRHASYVRLYEQAKEVPEWERKEKEQ